MAPTWCGNFFSRIGTSFGISFLQTGASLKKAHGSERERVTFLCIIQISNTSTWSSAPKLVEKSHVCPRVNFKVPCMQEMGMKFKHLGVVAQLETLRNLFFLVPVNPKYAWKSWNLAWCHDMAPTCCGNFFGRIGSSFGTSFLQTRASLKKARGSERERVTAVCDTTYVHYLLPP